MTNTTQSFAPLIIERDEALLGNAGSAWFSQDRRYRYMLTRRWGGPHPWMTFIMLNPSTADAFADDPTIRRCVSFARREGCGGLDVLNLFAWRATDPKVLRECPDPVGPDNDHVIRGHARNSVVVAAWGAHGTLRGRSREVADLLAAEGVRLKCLGVTADGSPRHPLYVRGDAPLLPWEPQP